MQVFPTYTTIHSAPSRLSPCTQKGLSVYKPVRVLVEFSSKAADAIQINTQLTLHRTAKLFNSASTNVQITPRRGIRSILRGLRGTRSLTLSRSLPSRYLRLGLPAIIMRALGCLGNDRWVKLETYQQVILEEMLSLDFDNEDSITVDHFGGFKTAIWCVA